MSTVLTAEKMHIQDAPRRLRFWRPDAAAKTFTLPAWALIVLTLIAPITIVIVMSFTDYQLGNTEVRWVGLENYSTLVLGDDFLRALNKHRSVCRTDSPCLGLCRTHARSIGQSGQNRQSCLSSALLSACCFHLGRHDHRLEISSSRRNRSHQPLSALARFCRHPFLFKS